LGGGDRDGHSQGPARRRRKFFENASYSLKEGFKPKGATYRIEQNASEVRLAVESLAVVFTRHKPGLRVEDQNGNVLIEEFAPLSWEDTVEKPIGSVVQKQASLPNALSTEALPPLEPKEGHAVLLTLKLGYDEHFYGLGEKALGLDLRHTYTQMWNTDAVGYGPGDDPLYQSHPFLIGLKEALRSECFWTTPTVPTSTLARSSKTAIGCRPKGAS